MTIKELQKEVHALATDKGWYDGIKKGDPKTVPEKLALIHSEVSEAMEEYRTGYSLTTVYHKSSEGGPGFVPGFSSRDDVKPEGFGVELADAVIRILDLAEFLNIDLEQLIERKHAFNKTRSYRHGNKFA